MMSHATDGGDAHIARRSGITTKWLRHLCIHRERGQVGASERGLRWRRALIRAGCARHRHAQEQPWRAHARAPQHSVGVVETGFEVEQQRRRGVGRMESLVVSSGMCPSHVRSGLVRLRR